MPLRLLAAVERPRRLRAGGPGQSAASSTSAPSCAVRVTGFVLFSAPGWPGTIRTPASHTHHTAPIGEPADSEDDFEMPPARARVVPTTAVAPGLADGTRRLLSRFCSRPAHDVGQISLSVETVAMEEEISSGPEDDELDIEEHEEAAIEEEQRVRTGALMTWPREQDASLIAEGSLRARCRSTCRSPPSPSGTARSQPPASAPRGRVSPPRRPPAGGGATSLVEKPGARIPRGRRARARASRRFRCRPRHNRVRRRVRAPARRAATRQREGSAADSSVRRHQPR